MSEFMPFIIIGLVTGSVYGLAGTGLVLTYKTSGIFNFAHGAVATTAAYAFFAMNVEHGVSWPIALLLSVFVLGPLLGVVLELVARRLAQVRTIYRIVATIGFILIVQGAFTAKYGALGQNTPPYLPTDEAFTISSTVVGWDQVIIFAIAVTCTSLLFAFFRFSRVGLAMRGVVDNVELLDLSGTSPARVRRWSWIIGSTFACLAGVLLVPSIGLDATVLTLMVVQAFGAAAIGYFSNLPLTFAGGLVVGVASSVLTKYGAVTTPNALLSGLPPSVPFLLLFVVLLLIPRRLLIDRRLSERDSVMDTWRAPLRVQVAGSAIALAVLIAVPFLISRSSMPTYTVALCTVVLFLSLGLLVKTSGQISLAHAGFAAIGATAFAHLANDAGLPWLVALLIGAAVAVPVGAIIAVPAIRLSGVFLALATMGFGIALEQMAYPLEIMFGTGTGGLLAPRPQAWGLDSDRGYYYLVLVFVVFFTAAVGWLHRSRLGRLLRALADSPTALSTHGATVNTTRVIVFCVSAFMAALYGGLHAGAITSVSPTTFDSFSSLVMLAVLGMALGGAPWYAFTAAAAMVIPGAYIHTEDLENWLNVVFGISAVVIAMLGGPPPMHAMRRIADRLGGRRAELAAAAEVPTVLKPAPPGHRRAEPAAARDAGEPGSGLKVEGLRVAFGGNVVVDGLSLLAPKGRITALIGPNGAGKTTTFNACCGLLRPSGGSISLHGRDISGLSPAARARLGMGRTFQRMELFDSMSVAENIALGLEASLAGANPAKHFSQFPGERAKVDEAVHAAADLCGINNWLKLPVGGLSTGQRRVVEIARTLAGPFDMLLLDEPSSGLNPPETERFGALLQRIISERDVGILLVEHDMELVMEICEMIYVLDFGSLIFKGTPEQVMSSADVRAAYLGSEAVTSAASTETTV